MNHHGEPHNRPANPAPTASEWARRLTVLVETGLRQQDGELATLEQEREALYDELVGSHDHLVQFAASIHLPLRSNRPSKQCIMIDVDGTDAPTPYTSSLFTWIKTVFNRLAQNQRVILTRSQHDTIIETLQTNIAEKTAETKEFTAFVHAHPVFVTNLSDCLHLGGSPHSVIADALRTSICGATIAPMPPLESIDPTQYMPDTAFAQSMLAWQSTPSMPEPVVRALAWVTKNDAQPSATEAEHAFLRTFGLLFLPTLNDTYVPKRWQKTDCRALVDPLPANVQFVHSYEALHNHPHTSDAETYTANTATTFLQNTSKKNLGAPSEDALLYAQHGNMLLAIIADGVSQSALGEVAAQQFTEQVYRVWKSLGFVTLTSQNILPELVIPAAWVAFHTTRCIVAQTIVSITDAFMRRIIERDNAAAGSQATFSVVLYDGSNITACWMGNTRIMLNTSPTEPARWLQGKNYMQSTSNPFTASDENFVNDRIRFSSHSGLTPVHRGLRGTPITHECIAPAQSTFRICIHSDALESVAADVYATPLTEHVVISDAVLAASTTKDDTTLIDIRIEKR